MTTKESLDRVKAGYSFETWRGTNQLNEHLFVYNFYRHPPQFEGWELHQSQLLTAPGRPPAVISTWKQIGAAGSGLLRSELYECASRMKAHELLIERLAEFQSVDVVRQEPPPVGDVAFVGPGEGAVLFARANLLFFIANASPNQVPALPLAHQLDAELIARPEVPAGGQQELSMRASSQAELQATTGRKQSVTPQVTQVTDLDKGVYYKIFSDKGEVSLEDDQLAFEAEETGSGQINVYTIRPDAQPQQQRIVVTVDEE
jgi:hypothetical protein